MLSNMIQNSSNNVQTNRNHYLGRGQPLSSTSVLTPNINNNNNNNHTQLYMGDLDPSWNESIIKQIWNNLDEPNINVKIITTHNMIGRNNPGYCFIEFLNKNLASMALLKNGSPIPGFPNKFLKLNWASLHSKQNQQQNYFNNNNNNDFSIFVGDLNSTVSETQLFELFSSRYPSTSNTKIVYDPITNLSKGYGFVKFLNISDQQNALLEMQGVILNGRPIRVSNTSHNNNNNNQNRFNNNNYNNNNQQQQFKSFNKNANSRFDQDYSKDKLSSSNFIHFQQQQQSISDQFTDPNNTTVFIGGLSSLVTQDELRAYFQPFGTIVYVKIPVGKGCGFVQYVDRLSAETAISKMQGFPIGNSRIRLSWGRFAKQSTQLEHQLYQQQQPLPQEQFYQQQPMLQNSTFGYDGNSIPITSIPNNTFGGPSVNQTIQVNNQNTFSNIPTNSTSILLPGYQELNFPTVPQPAGSGFDNLSQFEYNNISNQQQFLPNQSATPLSINNNSYDTFPGQQQLQQEQQPQLVLKDSELFVRNTEATLDRLEKGSNSFIFA